MAGRVMGVKDLRWEIETEVKPAVDMDGMAGDGAPANANASANASANRLLANANASAHVALAEVSARFQRDKQRDISEMLRVHANVRVHAAAHCQKKRGSKGRPEGVAEPRLSVREAIFQPQPWP